MISMNEPKTSEDHDQERPSLLPPSLRARFEALSNIHLALLDIDRAIAAGETEKARDLLQRVRDALSVHASPLEDDDAASVGDGAHASNEVDPD